MNCFQAILTQTKCFKCDCQRCLDPKEFGSNLSALKCKNKSAGCQGIANPIDPQSLDSDLICETCQFVISSQIAKMMQDTGRSFSLGLYLKIHRYEIECPFVLEIHLHTFYCCSAMKNPYATL